MAAQRSQDDASNEAFPVPPERLEVQDADPRNIYLFKVDQLSFGLQEAIGLTLFVALVLIVV